MIVLQLLSQVVLPGPGGRHPKYYRPYRLLIGSTADVLPGGAFWVHGGSVISNQFKEYGIWEGVFNVGLADMVEVKLSLRRLLSTVPEGALIQPNEMATSLKVSYLNLPRASFALEFRISPESKETFTDTIVLFSPEPLYKEIYREFTIRSALIYTPITLRIKGETLSLTLSPALYQYGLLGRVGGLPPLENCEGGVFCDSLRSWLGSGAFDEDRVERKVYLPGGYAGMLYTWRENTDIILEANVQPKLIYRGWIRDPLVSGYGRYSPSNRYNDYEVKPVVFSFLGIRYSILRYMAVDAGVVVPYDFSLPPGERLNLLNAVLYFNFHFIFSQNDVIDDLWDIL